MIKNLKRYLCDNKIRVGRPHDGGYVISAGHKYDLLLGAGIFDNVGFEDDFLDLNPGIPGLAFDKDALIDNSPRHPDRLKIIKKHISNHNSLISTTLVSESHGFSDIFLKMDIEGGEYKWINSFNFFKKFKQIIIEFHFLDSLKHDFYLESLEKLNRTHFLIHLHPNNCCPIHDYEGAMLPRVFECTFLRKDMIDNPITDFSSIPSPLDSANLSNAPDLALKGYPYTEFSKLKL